MLQDCTEWPVNKCSVRKEVVSKSTPETACRKVINAYIFTQIIINCFNIFAPLRFRD